MLFIGWKRKDTRLWFHFEHHIIWLSFYPDRSCYLNVNISVVYAVAYRQTIVWFMTSAMTFRTIELRFRFCDNQFERSYSLNLTHIEIILTFYFVNISICIGFFVRFTWSDFRFWSIRWDKALWWSLWIFKTGNAIIFHQNMISFMK